MPQNDPLAAVIDRSLNYGRHIISRYLAVAGKESMETVLDIGAGRGGDLSAARAQNPLARLHAVELNPAYQEELRGSGITVHPLNIEHDTFPFSDQALDVVMANQVLEHVKELFWIFHEVSRVLRVGGFFIIGVPNLASLHNRVLLALGKQPTCLQNHSAHVRGYTKSDLLKMMSICFPGGYKLEKFNGSNFYPFPPLIAKPLARMLPNMSWAIFLLLRKERAYNGEFLLHPTRLHLETNFYVGPP